jgi:hypothetical protein
MANRRGRRLRSKLELLIIASMSLVYGSCNINFELCTPQTAEFGFFSLGDCVLTRTSFFQGHEWLTFLANQDLPSNGRFSESEARGMAEGNRRVDYPKALLIHLNNGVIAYVQALIEYTDRPEVQRQHFLLTDRNSYDEAATEAQQYILELTVKALALWNDDRERALDLIGQAHHTIQDSFSPAHTVREPSDEGQNWNDLDDKERLSIMRCVRKVKAFAPRAEGFDSDDIEYHGASGGEDLAHTTPEDSIYRKGDDCHDPVNQEKVEACLSLPAQRARLATRDHLAMVSTLLRSGAIGQELVALGKLEAGNFIDRHLALCEGVK